MKKILTADNTETFLNEEVGESYHSQTGAVEEALKKFVIPCKIKELAGKVKEETERQGKEGTKDKTKIRILDVCFGMGYNSAMAVDVALQENPECEIEVIGLEKDISIIEKIQKVNPPIKFFRHYKKINPSKSKEISQISLEFREGGVIVKVIVGDARETIKELPEDYFDAVFFDPFSPKTMPEMWQVTLFEQIYRVMKSSAVLATYSCARLARENMGKAGLFWDDGPMVGRRGPGTVAVKWV